MAVTTYADYANVLLQNYGKLITQAFTEPGMKEGLVNPLSAFGRLQAWGAVRIGTGEVSDEKAFDFGIDTAADTAVSYGQNDTYTTDTPPVFGDAVGDWKRVGVPYSVDDLMRVTNAPLRNGANALDYKFRKKLSAIISKIETMLFTDGTGNSSKDVTGFKAFLSTGNTYFGIAQGSNSYWQASVVNAASTALSKALLRNVTGALWDKQVLMPNSHEMWMSRTQWNKYVDLFSPSNITSPTDAGGSRVGASYIDGMVDIPIFILPNMPNDEIWVIDKSTTQLRFTDQTPKDQLSADNVDEVMHEGVPIGIKYVPSQTDNTNLWIRAYPQLGCTAPRNNAALISLAT